MKKRLFCSLVSMLTCIALVVLILPQQVWAGDGETEFFDNEYYDENGVWHWEFGWTTTWENGIGTESGTAGSVSRNVFKYEKASNIDELIEICKKYSDKGTVTGVRNQIDWMNQLNIAASQDFVEHLGIGEILLISFLNHADINTTRLTLADSLGDINREIAKRIAEGVKGYADVDSIAKATGLTAEGVRGILEKIASGAITEKSIAAGKQYAKYAKGNPRQQDETWQQLDRGAYVYQQALEQDAVWQYLISEVDRMTGDADSLAVLCQDMGAGYVENMLSGQELDVYKVSLYKKHLAKTLDSVLDSGSPYSVATYDISKTDAYKVTKKTQSVLSKLFSYEVKAEKNTLPDEVKTFLDEHFKNGTLSESDARELLILSGTYQEDEYGLGEAAKQVAKGCGKLKKLEEALDKSGKVFGVIEKAKKAEEYISYWATDYSEQEILLDYLVENLSESGADMELMAAVKALQQEYEDKLLGTLEKASVALIEKGIGSVKSTYPPLGIAEASISLASMITGDDKRVDALETGLAMQGICQQALTDYKNAVIAVSNGADSEDAVSRVLTTFETARQSLISYYEAMTELAETDSQKQIYSLELKKLEAAEFGYATVDLPFGGGGLAGGR